MSYDEKPGIQAIATTSADKVPVPNTEKVSIIIRDYEYKGLGTLSLLAAIAYSYEEKEEGARAVPTH